MGCVGLAFSRLSVPAAVGILDALDAVLVARTAHVGSDLKTGRRHGISKKAKSILTSINEVSKSFTLASKHS